MPHFENQALSPPHLGQAHGGEEGEEHALVALANAVADGGAMVVESAGAAIADLSGEGGEKYVFYRYLGRERIEAWDGAGHRVGG